LDGYKRPLVDSLSANLQRFGAKMEQLQEIIEQMTEDARPAIIPTQIV
jgi:outer membrane murein-binding lipoprotein Lpp